MYIPNVLRFLVIILLGYTGFLCVNELQSLRVQDIAVFAEYMSITIKERKKNQYREGHTILVAKSGKCTCPVSTTGNYFNTFTVVLLVPL